MLTLDQFTYHLPTERIAQTPMQPRDHSRLLVVNRETGELAHHHFYELPELLHPGDVLVRNNTKVMPARIYGKKNTGGDVEILLSQSVGHATWECLTKPGLKAGQTIVFANGLTARCAAVTGYTRQLVFNLTGAAFFDALDAIGHTPTPPYIHWQDEDEQELRQLYQTTFAEIAGSVAAPTAGLHFTPELGEQLRSAGVQIETVTLHVGLGTFLSVKTEDIAEHLMHREWFTLDEAVAARLNIAKQAGRRIIAVGTTSTRVLETCADDSGKLTAHTDYTQLYVYPPHRFKFVDAMITNFHEPNTTLIMLVAAFCSAPNTSREFTSFSATSVGEAYAAALEAEYRFLSFGDAMLLG